MRGGGLVRLTRCAGPSVPWLAALCFLLSSLPAPAQSGDGRLYYHSDGKGGVTITNVWTRGARPVPGIERERTKIRARVALPATPYDAFIARLADELGLSSDLIKAVGMIESNFNPRAVSPKGARGIMQLMPATARLYGVTDSFDPLQNLRAGALHLRHLLQEFDGDVNLALAAYNAGSGAVRRSGGVPNYPETIDYVQRVRSALSLSESSGAVPRPRSRAALPPRKIRAERRADGTIVFTN